MWKSSKEETIFFEDTRGFLIFASIRKLEKTKHIIIYLIICKDHYVWSP